MSENQENQIEYLIILWVNTLKILCLTFQLSGCLQLEIIKKIKNRVVQRKKY